MAIVLTRLLSNTLIQPVVKLAHNSRKIARNDFSGEDLAVPNRDEMGELVAAFNKMKHATEGYINTLKKNNEMAGASSLGRSWNVWRWKSSWNQQSWSC